MLCRMPLEIYAAMFFVPYSLDLASASDACYLFGVIQPAGNLSPLLWSILDRSGARRQTCALGARTHARRWMFSRPSVSGGANRLVRHHSPVIASVVLISVRSSPQ